MSAAADPALPTTSLRFSISANDCYSLSETRTARAGSVSFSQKRPLDGPLQGAKINQERVSLPYVIFEFVT